MLALAATPAALALRFTDDDFDMPVAQVGVPFSKEFHGGAGCGPALPYQYRILSGDLPPGITLDESGLFSGSPIRVGSWSFWVELSDQDPPTASWCVPKRSQREFTITVAPAALNAEVARPFEQTLPGTGWSIAPGSSLPEGLSFDPSTGLISGEPASVGTSPVTFVLANAYGWRNSVTVSVHVAPPVGIVSRAPRTAKAGRAYAFRFEAGGGLSPYRWKVVAGALPAGIRLGSRTGALTGTTHKTGTRRLTVQVSDRLHAISTRTFVLRIVR